MGANTKIEWAHHTFNVVWGCLKVSPGCENCYALGEANRRGFDVWGPPSNTPRRILSDEYWHDPLRWQRRLEKTGERERVFCSSMADFAEDHPTTREQVAKLWPLIQRTPNLDWMLLTKRPQLLPDVLPRDWSRANYPNAWLGTSCESQFYHDARVWQLYQIEAIVHFLSCEPLLDRLRLRAFCPSCRNLLTSSISATCGVCMGATVRPSWVIVGGESGPKARPMHARWARELRDQCSIFGVPFFFKQWGEYLTGKIADDPEWLGGAYVSGEGITKTSVKHPDVHIWPDGFASVREGKRRAGRLLDGAEWSQFPTTDARGIRHDEVLL